MKGLVFVSVACFVVGLVYGSAIPVWEFLKREEKVAGKPISVLPHGN